LEVCCRCESRSRLLGWDPRLIPVNMQWHHHQLKLQRCIGSLRMAAVRRDAMLCMIMIIHLFLALQSNESCETNRFFSGIGEARIKNVIHKVQFQSAHAQLTHHPHRHPTTFSTEKKTLIQFTPTTLSERGEGEHQSPKSAGLICPQWPGPFSASPTTRRRSYN
jgi:hypothetical protein